MAILRHDERLFGVRSSARECAGVCETSTRGKFLGVLCASCFVSLPVVVRDSALLLHYFCLALAALSHTFIRQQTHYHMFFRQTARQTGVETGAGTKNTRKTKNKKKIKTDSPEKGALGRGREKERVTEGGKPYLTAESYFTLGQHVRTLASTPFKQNVRAPHPAFTVGKKKTKMAFYVCSVTRHQRKIRALFHLLFSCLTSAAALARRYFHGVARTLSSSELSPDSPPFPLRRRLYHPTLVCACVLACPKQYAVPQQPPSVQ